MMMSRWWTAVSCFIFILSGSGIAWDQIAAPTDEAAFIGWLNEQGLNTLDLELYNFGPRFGRGVRTLRPRQKGCTLFTVPSRLVLSLALAFDSEIGKLLEQYWQSSGLAKSHIFPIFLVYELLKGNHSSWSPYFKAVGIPKGHPLYWRYVLSLDVDVLE